MPGSALPRRRWHYTQRFQAGLLAPDVHPAGLCGTAPVTVAGPRRLFTAFPILPEDVNSRREPDARLQGTVEPFARRLL